MQSIMGKKKDSPKPVNGNDGQAASAAAPVDPEMLRVIGGLTPQQLATIVSLGTAVLKESGQAPQRSGAGYYNDPKTGKTYRLRKPKRRSRIYNEARALEKAAVNALKAFTDKNDLVWKRPDPTNGHKEGLLTTSSGSAPSKELKEEHERLMADLKNARDCFKAVRENSRGSTKVKTLDPSARPQIRLVNGKPKWADMTD